MSQNKTAIVLGATGLIGSQLLKLLMNDDQFSKIIIPTRRSVGIQHPKVEELIIDFNQSDTYQSSIKGDVFFSCLGTTIKKAGSKAAMHKVDYTYQYEMAKSAFENNVQTHVLVSSSNAKANSYIFYSRLKGELEEAVSKLGFSRLLIFRPSVLMGERPEKRFGEEFGAKFINGLGVILPFLRKYRGIQGAEVAQAMLNAYHQTSEKKVEIYELDKIFEYL